MSTTIRFRYFIVGAVSALSVATGAFGQVRRTEPARSQVQVTIDLKMGSAHLEAAGSGACTHAPKASIYDVPSQLRAVRFASSGHSMQLSVWDPLDGSPDMFTLVASAGGQTARIATVRKGSPSGSGTAAFEPAGKGGTFRIEGRTADGIPVAGTIACDAFTPHVAEGG